MALGPMFSGQTPAEPALITVTTPDGEARDLTDYTANGVLYAPDGTDVSAGSFTQIADELTGLVQFDWPVPSAFDEAGIYLLQIELTTADPDFLDFTTSVEVEVLPALPPSATTNVLTTNEVYTLTNRTVSTADIAKAQMDIILILGTDFVTSWATLTETSQYWLKLAVAHQAGWDTTADAGRPVGATSVKIGDVSVTYSGGGAADEVMLAPMARLALNRIRPKTLYATPFLGDPLRTPMRPMWEYQGWAGV